MYCCDKKHIFESEIVPSQSGDKKPALNNNYENNGLPTVADTNNNGKYSSIIFSELASLNGVRLA
jgi:hypothetical protein